MCGIVAYTGHKACTRILLEGLKRLEYRGYDSAGMAMVQEGVLAVRRAAGRISALEQLIGEDPLEGVTGIAHTRWATHGAPTKKNAHPHLDDTGRIGLVHNGIIENYTALKTWLQSQGKSFRSETDSEVLVNLISHFYQGNLVDAVQKALGEVKGTYGIAVVSADHPNTIVAARKGSPLLLGVGENEYVVASDASAIVEHTTSAVYLDDGEMVEITPEGFRTLTLDNNLVSKELENIEFSLQQIELDGYEHFMLKEIFEQPVSVQNTLRGRVDLEAGQAILGGLQNVAGQLSKAKRIIITACGTAWHAGLVGEFLLEHLARIPTEVEYASEFRYRNPIIEPGTVVIAISQSGETADTLAALREAKQRGALALGIVNVVGSTIARETNAGVYLHCGPEIGVASTKAFSSQLVMLALLAIELGRQRSLDQQQARELLGHLSGIPGKIEKVLAQSDQIRQVAQLYLQREHWLFLGRGYNYPVALEGALKLKEISYSHAEGLPAAEMKHGPIALINEGMPTVFIATSGSQYEKVLSNIEEVRARGGKILAVATENNAQIHKHVDHVFTIPEIPEPLSPLLTVVPLQLLAYHTAVGRDCAVDKPRNLAKSVTVE
ncbi:MAG: glutamine--fructose-6-phosphate transaminase (isomerizing) [Actinobacteria bacterium]|nr:glutamine--fructose-6-phosphate transaminase (isomerizing) [Actinomycetota bacterium]